MYWFLRWEAKKCGRWKTSDFFYNSEILFEKHEKSSFYS